MKPRLQPHSHEVAVRRLDDRGATIVEYALLVALIAVVSIGALSFLGRSASDTFEDVAGSIALDPDQGTAPGSGGGPGGGPGPGGPGPGGPGGGGADDDDGAVGGEEVDNPEENGPPEENEPPAGSTEFAGWSASRS